MDSLRIYLITGWLTLLAVSVYAVNALGLFAGSIFLTDFLHPWRAQFNMDFVLHLVLFGAWVVWREPSKKTGITCAVCSMFGGVFTLPYLVMALFRADGDVVRLLLGKHWRVAARV